jgi:hypothetical protein
LELTLKRRKKMDSQKLKAGLKTVLSRNGLEFSIIETEGNSEAITRAISIIENEVTTLKAKGIVITGMSEAANQLKEWRNKYNL